jgi:hypothetical protein
MRFSSNVAVIDDDNALSGAVFLNQMVRDMNNCAIFNLKEIPSSYYYQPKNDAFPMTSENEPL